MKIRVTGRFGQDTRKEEALAGTGLDLLEASCVTVRRRLGKYGFPLEVLTVGDIQFNRDLVAYLAIFRSEVRVECDATQQHNKQKKVKARQHSWKPNAYKALPIPRARGDALTLSAPPEPLWWGRRQRQRECASWMYEIMDCDSE